MSGIHSLINHQIEYLLVRSWFQGEVEVRPASVDSLHLADHMALIVLGQQEAALNLRVFIAAESLRAFTHLRFPSLAGEIDDRRAIAWLKEFTNTTAGRIKHVLSEYALAFEHSLPFYLPGYLQVFFKTGSKSCYEFSFSGIKLYLYADLSLKDPDLLQCLAEVDRDAIFRINDQLAAGQADFDL